METSGSRHSCARVPLPLQDEIGSPRSRGSRGIQHAGNCLPAVLEPVTVRETRVPAVMMSVAPGAGWTAAAEWRIRPSSGEQT